MSDNLYRTRINKVIGGVAAGIAEYFKIDLMLVRILFIILTIFNGIGLLIYIVLWIILPMKPYNEYVFNMGIDPNEEENPDSFRQMEKSRNKGALFFGVLLILLGVLFLFENMIPDFSFFDIFPLVIIGAGVYMILRATGKKHEKQD